MLTQYALVVNRAEESAEIEEVDMAEIWSANRNPNGWTYQDITGPHGTFWGVYPTRAEALEARFEVLGF